MPEEDVVADGQAWAAALDALELHLERIRAGLVVGAMPEPYVVGLPEGPPPLELVGECRRILAEQADVERALRERMTAFAGALRRAAPAAAVPVYLDRRE